MSGRDATRLDGTRGKMQVCRPHVQAWGLSEANVVWKYLWYFWDFSVLPQWFGAWGIVSPLPLLVTPL